MSAIFIVVFWVKIRSQQLVDYFELVGVLLDCSDVIAVVTVILRVIGSYVVFLLDSLGFTAGVDNHVERLGAWSLTTALKSDLTSVWTQPVCSTKSIIQELLVALISCVGE